jgi:hypothetical protein
MTTAKCNVQHPEASDFLLAPAKHAGLRGTKRPLKADPVWLVKILLIFDRHRAANES